MAAREEPEVYLERTALRGMLAALLEKVCKDKPDNLAAFMLEYLSTAHPELAAAAVPANTPASLGTWAPAAGVEPTQAGLQDYLKAVNARPTLEFILEKALREQPTNVVAFVIEYLCEGGAGEGSAEPAGEAAQEAAAAIVEAPVIERHPQADALFEAVGDGDLETMVQLLDSGVPVDSLNGEGSTALIIAAEGEPACVEALLARQCPLNHRNKDGHTALIAATKYQDAEIVQLLVNAGSDLALRDVEGKTAAEVAYENEDEAIVYALTGERLEVKEEAPAPPAKPRRNSVSSESIDPKKKVDLSLIPVVEKDAETYERIRATIVQVRAAPAARPAAPPPPPPPRYPRLAAPLTRHPRRAPLPTQSILFKSLDEEQMAAVIKSMTVVTVAAGEAIITQARAAACPPPAAPPPTLPPPLRHSLTPRPRLPCRATRATSFTSSTPAPSTASSRRPTPTATASLSSSTAQEPPSASWRSCTTHRARRAWWRRRTRRSSRWTARRSARSSSR